MGQIKKLPHSKGNLRKDHLLNEGKYLQIIHLVTWVVRVWRLVRLRSAQILIDLLVLEVGKERQ